MKIIPQKRLFDYSEIEELGDLERLKAVLDQIPDAKLIEKLRKLRKNGRDEYPVVGMWNAFLASFVFQHHSINSLIRELSRNPTMLKLCGLKKVPTASAFTNFLSNLKTCQDELNEMFQSLVSYMYNNLEGFGEILAIDGKAIQSYAPRKNENKEVDGRRDTDANTGIKKYSVSEVKGDKIAKTISWFGYKLHLICDATYELPVEFDITVASVSDVKKGQEMLENFMESKAERCKYVLADKGYDSTELIVTLEKKGIKAVIDIRNMWKDGEETRQFRDTDVVYDYKGAVYYQRTADEKIKLLFKGYDKSTDSLRYGFPAKYKDKRIFRILLSTDRRIFTAVARDSKKWENLYKMRTSVERENGRVDRDLGFELHTIRGLEKMKTYMSVGFLVKLSLAKYKIENNKEHIAAFVA